MGIGPWDQAKLVKDTKRAERARFRAIVADEVAQLIRRKGGASKEVVDALMRVRARITPKVAKPKTKKMMGVENVAGVVEEA